MVSGEQANREITNVMKVTKNCPKCGEPVTIILTKKDVKAILAGFKLPELRRQGFIEMKLRDHYIDQPPAEKG